LLLLIILSGIIYSKSYLISSTPTNLPYDEIVTIEGNILEKPEISSTQKVILRVKASSLNNLVNQKVLVTTQVFPKYIYGDKIKVIGKIQKPEKFDNFDYPNYLAKSQIFSIISFPKSIELISGNQESHFKNEIVRAGDSFEKAINNNLHEPLAALANGITIGLKNNIPKETLNNFNTTGTSHIVVASGQNTEIVTNILLQILSGFSRIYLFTFSTIGIIFYVILAGGSASILRAGIMAWLLIFAKFIGRKGKIINILIFTGFIMVVLNPLILRYDMGFQLSFAAMLGLIYLTPIFDRIFWRIPKIFRVFISSTLGAQLATIPILLISFGKISMIAPLANVFVLMAVPPAMIFGFLTGIFGMINIILGKIFSFALWPLLKYILFIVATFSKIPYASINLNVKTIYFPIIYYFVLTLIIVKFYNKNRIENEIKF